MKQLQSGLERPLAWLLAALIVLRNGGRLAQAATNEAVVLPELVVTDDAGQRKSFAPPAISSPKYTEALINIPRTVTIVPGAVMEEQNATTLRDVLRNVPGISIQAGEGGVPAGDNLTVRGFSARTDLYVDGVRDFGGYTRDTFNVEQVEVAKGPSSAQAGRGSTGGSINMVSKTPNTDPSMDGTLGIGTDNYMRFTADANQPVTDAGDGALRVNALYHNADTPGRDEVTSERWGVAPAVSFGLGEPTRLTVGYYYLGQDNVPDYGIPWVATNNVPLAAYRDKPAPVDFENFYGILDRDYEETATHLGTATFEHDYSDTVRLRNILRYGLTDRDSIISAPRFNTPDSTAVTRNPQSRDQRDSIVSDQLNLTVVDVQTGDVTHDIATGVEASYETSENRPRTIGAAPLADLQHPNPHDPYTGTITSAAGQNTSDALSAAIYAFDTIKLGEQWELNGGLRGELFDVDYRSATDTEFDQDDEMLSWQAGAVYKPQANGSLYAAVGNAYNPSAEGLTLNADIVGLDPEETQTAELGTKWDLLGNRLALTAAIFRTEKTNARTQDPADPDDLTVLQGEQRVDGFELGAAGALTERWDLFGAYTYLSSEVLDSQDPNEIGKELANTPENTVGLWTSYNLMHNLDVGAGASYVDSRYSNNLNVREAPDYWLYDAMAAYVVNENVTLRLNVYNLTDEEYIDRVGGGHFIPGAARSATLTASLDF